MRLKHWYGFVMLVLWGMACEPGPEVVVLRDVEFAPLKKGMFWIYQVDSTVISANIEQKYQYQLQVEITDSIAEVPGQAWYVLTRSKRPTSNAAFTPLVPWSARRNAQQFLVREGNTVFEALAFPVIAGRVWNGNAFNGLGGDEFCEGTGACDLYSYVELGATRVAGGTTFTDVLSVAQGNTPDRLVKFDVRTSYYARHVGLIEREYRVLDYCTLPACFGRQFVDRGLVYSQTLISHGQR